MSGIETIDRNLRLKQDAFFLACERAGLTMNVLAARSGVPVETLRSYRTTRSREPSIMGLAAFVKLTAALPPEHSYLASLLIEDSDCVIARPVCGAEAWLRLGEKTGAFASKVCRFQASDGHIDHREDAELREDSIEIISLGHGILGSTS